MEVLGEYALAWRLMTGGKCLLPGRRNMEACCLATGSNTGACTLSNIAALALCNIACWRVWHGMDMYLSMAASLSMVLNRNM